MADNVGITPGSGAKAASREVSYSGETAQVQVVGLATLAGDDDAKTVADVSSANPLPVLLSNLKTTHPVFGDPGAIVRQAPSDIWTVALGRRGRRRARVGRVERVGVVRTRQPSGDRVRRRSAVGRVRAGVMMETEMKHDAETETTLAALRGIS